MGPRVIAERELISGNPAFFRVTPLGLALCRKGYRESVHVGDEILICTLSCDEYGRIGQLDWLGRVSSSTLNLSRGRGGIKNANRRTQGHASFIRRQLSVCASAKPVYGGADAERNSRGDWAERACGSLGDLRAGERVSPGRDPDSYADSGCCGSRCEPGGAGVDLASAFSAFGAMAQAGDYEEGTAIGAVAGGAGSCDADSGGAGDVDASDGASHGVATGCAIQFVLMSAPIIEDPQGARLTDRSEARILMVRPSGPEGPAVPAHRFPGPVTPGRSHAKSGLLESNRRSARR